MSLSHLWIHNALPYWLKRHFNVFIDFVFSYLWVFHPIQYYLLYGGFALDSYQTGKRGAFILGLNLGFF